MPACVVLLAGWLISGATAGWFWREAEQVDRLRFGAAVTNLLEHLDSRTERYAEQLERLADYVADQEKMSTGVWEELVSRIGPVANLPGFVELAYATNAALPPRAEVEAKRLGPLELFRPYPIQLKLGPQWRNGLSVAASDTESWLVQPEAKPRWWRVLNGRMCSTRRRSIATQDGHRISTVGLLVPVFTGDLTDFAELIPVSHQEELRGYRCRGVVIGTLGWDAFLKTALPSGTDQVAFDAFVGVEDGSPLTEDAWLGHDGLQVPPPLMAGFAPRFRHLQGWPFYRTRWQLVFHSTPAFERQSNRYRAWVALGVGTVLSALMAGLLGVQILGRRRQEAVSARLQEALQALESARSERERLNHDLHDGAIQSLYALQLGLSRATDQAQPTQPALAVRLADCRRNLTGIIGELRGYILRHEAGPGPAGDLPGVLMALIERLRGTTETELHAGLSAAAAGRLTGEQAVHLANLTREALSNALRHAHASRIVVTLRDEPPLVTLEIADDGDGFDPSAPPRTGVGLTSMAARAREAGGELQVHSTVGGGTQVRVSVRPPQT